MVEEKPKLSKLSVTKRRLILVASGLALGLGFRYVPQEFQLLCGHGVKLLYFFLGVP